MDNRHRAAGTGALNAMVWSWDKATRMDGDGKRRTLQSPGSDWWLRSLVVAPDAVTSGPDRFPTNVATPVDRPTFTAHPDEVAPVRQDAYCSDTREDRGDIPQLNAPPQTVIMGIIDDGLAFANARFLKPGPGGTYQTRMAAFWNQDATCGRTRPTPGYTLPFGKDWTEAEINTGLFVYPDGIAYPDPIFAYCQAEMTRALAGSVQHGTHVMDLATGYDCDSIIQNELGEVPAELATRRPIVAVQLADLATRNSTGAFMGPYVTHAIGYILDRAIRLQPETGDRIPVVLNFSYGVFASALNGRAHIEEWIDDAVQTMWEDHEIPVWVVLPAGNSHMERTRGDQQVSATRPDRHTPPLILRHQPENKAPTVVEFWWPERTTGLDAYGLERVRGIKNGLDDGHRRHIVDHLASLPSPLRLELRPPHARDWIELPTDAVNFFHGVPLVEGGQAVAMAYHEALLSFGRMALSKNEREVSVQLKMTLVLAPSTFEHGIDTFEFPQRDVTLPAGDWEVRIWNTDADAPETVTVRCQRNDTPFGFRPFGRQTRLEDQGYRFVRPDGRPDESDDHSTWVFRHGTTNAISTGSHSVRVGSFRKSALNRRQVASNHIANGGASVFSSAGDQGGTSPRSGVDLAAASEVSHTMPGVLAAGTHSGSRVRLSGTSAAAPQVARWIALTLAKPDVAPMRETLVTAAANSVEPYFEDSEAPARTGARLLLGPGAR